MRKKIIVIALLSVVLLALVGADPAYKLLSMPPGATTDLIEAALNKVATQGWRVATSYVLSGWVHFVLIKQ
jgi:hypothetical protein